MNAVNGSARWTPLHVAAEFNSGKVIYVLLRGEINVNARSHNEYTPLHTTAYYGSEKAIDALLKAKVIDVNAVN
ncbi:ankyrin repeat domain-containing protein [Wolbachia pipientis]|uniref:ankyrin repeat domain-containing protein n=1 Tax=Wolbachia pipientis TaxID=955 RepID=UPI0025A49218|nr:ankyrin repeat domain-containing protein [Wolbachia pipientis]MDM8335777.1 ankyrin repeat domain-containing protein [Wolbachia pipientis]